MVLLRKLLITLIAILGLSSNFLWAQSSVKTPKMTNVIVANYEANSYHSFKDLSDLIPNFSSSELNLLSFTMDKWLSNFIQTGEVCGKPEKASLHCVRRLLRVKLKSEHIQDKISHIEYEFYKKLDNDLIKENKRLTFSFKKFSLAQLHNYLYNKNKFNQIAKRDSSEDKTVQKFFKRYYKTKLPKLGKIHPLDRMFLMFKWGEIAQMAQSGLRILSLRNFTSGKIVLDNSKTTELEDLGDKIVDQGMKYVFSNTPSQQNNLLEKMKDMISDYTSLNNSEVYQSQKSNQDQIQETKKKIQSLILSMNESSTSEEIEIVLEEISELEMSLSELLLEQKSYLDETSLSPREIHHIVLAVAERELKKINMRGEGARRTLADIVMAMYIMNTKSNKIIMEVLNEKEFQNNFVPLKKRITNKIMTVVQIGGMIFPEAMPFVTIGSVIYQSIVSKKEEQRRRSNEIYLF